MVNAPYYYQLLRRSKGCRNAGLARARSEDDSPASQLEVRAHAHPTQLARGRAKSGPKKSTARDLRRLAAAAVVGAGLVGSAWPTTRRRPLPSSSRAPPGRDAVVRRHRRSREARRRVDLDHQRGEGRRSRSWSWPGAGPGAGPGGRPFEGFPTCPTIIRSTSSSRTCRVVPAAVAATRCSRVRARRRAPASSSRLTATSSPTITSSTAPTRSRSASTIRKKIEAKI